MVRKRKSWREATIISRLDPDHWRAEYPGGGSGMFREADILAEPRAISMPGRSRCRCQGDLDAEMVAIAGAIIRQRTGNFDPSIYHDRYQEALQQVIEAKMKGVTIEPPAVSTPSPAIDLMAALKRSLAQEPSAPEQRKQTKKAPDQRQPALLLPLTGARKRNQRPSADPAVSSVKKRSSTR
jgi:hypothetical protein